MNKIDILIKETEQRIAQLEADELIDSSKKAILIRENKRFLVLCLQLFSSNEAVKSLPTDECVDQWWAEGQDQEKGFWQEAPYRTNGDVVEEIKTALKYFIQT